MSFLDDVQAVGLPVLHPQGADALQQLLGGAKTPSVLLNLGNLVITGTYQLVGQLHLLHRLALLGVGDACPQSPFGPSGQKD